MVRIFRVRLNLDEMSAHMNTFATDAERGEWCRGFMSGAAGGIIRFNEGAPGAMGHSLGAESLANATKYQEQQSAFGTKSAEARKTKYGTAQPERPFEGGSNDPSMVVRRSSEGTPNLSSNRVIELASNPVIEQTSNPITKRKRAAPQRSDAEQFIHDNKFRVCGTDTEKRSSLKDAVSHFGEAHVHAVMGRIRNVWASALHAEIQNLIRDDIATKAKQDKLREEQERIFA